jgi:hypothetical protein
MKSPFEICISLSILAIVYIELFFSISSMYTLDIIVCDSPADQIKKDIEIDATLSSIFQGSIDLHRCHWLFATLRCRNGWT